MKSLFGIDAEAHSCARKPGSADSAADPGAEAERTEVMARLFREHNAALIHFLRARLRSTQEAREVAQEAYVRLLSLDSPGAVSYLRALLFRIAANLAVDRLRRHEVHGRAMDSAAFQEFADGCTPERHLAGAQSLQRLERLIDALPAKMRRAFVLNRFDGLDFPQIAQLMNIPERTARFYVEQALLKCQAGLDRE